MNSKLGDRLLFWLALIPGRSKDQGFPYWMEHGTPTSRKLTLESLHTQVMLILILIKVHYLQNVIFIFKKD